MVLLDLRHGSISKSGCSGHAAPCDAVGEPSAGDVFLQRRLLTGAATEEQIKAFREHERTDRALGNDDFQKRLEKKLGRVLRRQKLGPKKPGCNN